MRVDFICQGPGKTDTPSQSWSEFWKFEIQWRHILIRFWKFEIQWWHILSRRATWACTAARQSWRWPCTSTGSTLLLLSASSSYTWGDISIFSTYFLHFLKLSQNKNPASNQVQLNYGSVALFCWTRFDGHLSPNIENWLIDYLQVIITVVKFSPR